MSMTYYTPQPANFDAGAAFDYRGLERLRQSVSGKNARSGMDATDAENREVARQFEALFLQMMIRRMREATPRDGLFESDQTRMVQSLADEQLATQLANPGIGLAQALLDQIQAQQAQQGRQAETDVATGADGTNLRPAGLRPELASSRLSGLGSRTQVKAQATGSASTASSHVQNFVSRMAGLAQHAAARIGMPAPLVLAQAALESGWGAREIRHPDGRPSHNLFGIKATGNWKGDVVQVMTTEYDNGVPRKVTQSFRAYRSYAESFEDYARLLTSHPRYEQVLAARSAPEAARRLQAAGYATDPGYANKLIGIMSAFSGTGTGQARATASATSVNSPRFIAASR